MYIPCENTYVPFLKLEYTSKMMFSCQNNVPTVAIHKYSTINIKEQFYVIIDVGTWKVIYHLTFFINNFFQVL